MGIVGLYVSHINRFAIIFILLVIAMEEAINKLKKYAERRIDEYTKKNKHKNIDFDEKFLKGFQY